ALGDEQASEDLTEGVVVLSPAQADELQQKLALFALAIGEVPVRLTPGVAAVQDEAAHALGMAKRVRDRDGAALRDAEQGEAVQLQVVDDGLEIADPGLERELVDRPVGEAAAALVVADQSVIAGQLPDPVAPDRALAVVLEVTEPVGRLHQRLAAPAGGVGDTRSVGCGAEADPL